MSTNHTCVLALLLLIPAFSFSQKQYKTPVHSVGLEVNWSVSGLEDYRQNFDLPALSSSYHIEGFGGSVVVPYQYAPKSSFFGLQSGLGFFMWGNRYRKGGGLQTETESLYSVGVPVVAQLKVSRAFWLETGLQVNFAVYNTLRDAGNWDSSTTFLEESPGKIPIAELQAILGFRYHFFRSFSFKARIHYGLTPAYRISYPAYPPEVTFDQNFRYRFLVFEMGLSYLFPLKK